MNHPENENLLEVYDLKKYFPIKTGVFQRTTGHVKALDGVSFDVPRGKTLGLVGESGCGKTTAGRTIVALYKPTQGEMYFDVPKPVIAEIRDLRARLAPLDQKSHDARDLHARIDAINREYDVFSLPRQELNRRRREFQMVFQDPYGSLNPRMAIGNIIGEGLDIHKGYRTKSERKRMVEELMDVTGIDPGYINRYPHEFSGGQRQRIGIARALALKPKLVVLDEPVSALDVSIQTQILDLLNKLKAEFGLTYIFIAHDLSVVEYFSDTVAVMYLGRVCEIADRAAIYGEKLHPYTQALISACPVPDPDNKSKRIILTGDVPSPINPPPGCNFHPRCPYKMDICSRREPPLVEVKGGHRCACWLHIPHETPEA